MLPREYAVAPYDKEPFKKRQMEKEKLIKESEKVFDDIELYGLVATNNLLKISRIQQKISKSDFSTEFIEFRKKLYKTIEKTGDQIIDVVKHMREEFTNVKLNINDNMRRKLRRNKGPSSEIEEHFNELKEQIQNGVNKTESYVNHNAEKIEAMLFYLKPPAIEVNLEPPKDKVIDWNRRLQRRRRIMVLRKFIDTYYDKRLDEIDEANENLFKELDQKDQERYRTKELYEYRKKREEREKKEKQLKKRRAEKELQARLMMEKMRMEAEIQQAVNEPTEEVNETTSKKEEEPKKEEEKKEEEKKEEEVDPNDYEEIEDDEEEKKEEEKKEEPKCDIQIPDIPDTETIAKEKEEEKKKKKHKKTKSKDTTNKKSEKDKKSKKVSQLKRRNQSIQKQKAMLLIQKVMIKKNQKVSRRKKQKMKSNCNYIYSIFIISLLIQNVE